MLCVISKVKHIEHLYTENISRLIIYTVNLTSGMRLGFSLFFHSLLYFSGSFVCCDFQSENRNRRPNEPTVHNTFSNKQTITVSVVDRSILFFSLSLSIFVLISIQTLIRQTNKMKHGITFEMKQTARNRNISLEHNGQTK